MDDVLFVGRLQGVFLKSVYFFERMAVGRNRDTVKQIEHLVFVEDVRLLAGEILCGEHEIVGKVKGLHDALGGIHGIEQSGAVLAVGFHGIGVVHENGNHVAFLRGFGLAMQKRLRKGQS